MVFVEFFEPVDACAT